MAEAEKSPVEIVNREQMEATIDRMRVVVPDGKNMNTAQLAVIAQESILYRTMPGKDIHYWLDKGELKSSVDYKRLVAWATARERHLTSNPQAAIDPQFIPLSPADKKREGLIEEDVATYCHLTTGRDQDLQREEVAKWIKVGLTVAQALEITQKTFGEIGIRAIGVVFDGQRNIIPQGWSKMQKARKLALKNAINMKYGSPSVDEMASMTKSLARIDTIDEDWERVPLDEPSEVQAIYAEMNAIDREARSTAASMTIDEHNARLASNPLRPPEDQDDEIGIGEETEQVNDWFRFANALVDQIGAFQRIGDVEVALGALGLEYCVEDEEVLLDELGNYADSIN